MKRMQRVMAESNFEAPDWVRNNEAEKELTPKQKKLLIAVLIVVTPFCLWAGWFEFGRAHNGNWRAWVYTFEWPFFALIAIYLGRRIMKGNIPRIPRPNLKDILPEDDGKSEQ